jgi:outer membrane protein insertion porin family
MSLRQRVFTRILPWLACAAIAAPLLRAQAPPDLQGREEQRPDGQRIVAVRVVSEAAEVLEENPAALPLHPGDSFDSEVVRESLRQLYRSGRFADIRAETAEAPGGLRLDFVVRPNLFINTVRVTGLAEPPTPQQAESALQLNLGEAFSQGALDTGLERLGETLREEGFYGAVLDPVLDRKPETRQIDVTVRVEPGRRAVLGTIDLNKIELNDPTAYPNAELLRKSKLKPGKKVTAASLDRGAERLRKWLFKRGHLGARVTIRRGNYDASTNRLPITLDIAAGPPVRVEVTGAKLSQSKIHSLVPVFQEGGVDEDLLQEGRRGLRDYFERKGYFYAGAQYTIREDEKTHGRVIAYSVTLGPRHRLEKVIITGNKYFSADDLSDRLSLVPAAFLSPGTFSERLLRDDIASIHDLYAANGFAAAEVKGEVKESRPGSITVHIEIHEGEQTRVEQLTLEGNHAFDTATVLSVVGSTVGQPYSEFDVSADRDNILALYYNEGFPEVHFEAVAQPAAKPNRINLSYRIVEGRRINVKQVLVSGYEHTRLGIIQRQIDVQPGGPLRQGEVVETQRRLYDLGVFTRVNVAPQNPGGDETEKTVVVNVQEAKRFTIGYGGGFEVQRLASKTNPNATELAASPRGILDLGWANFGGRGHTLAFKVRASTLQGRALLSYTAPNFLNRRNFSLQLITFADKSRDVSTFTSTRYEGSLQLAYRVTPFTSLLFRYFYRHVLVSSLQVSTQQIPLFSQPTKTSGVGFTWLRDKRDNPADATRGNFTTADVSLAARPLGASATFLRFFAQNSSFHPLGHGLVFARSGRVGVEEPLAGSIADNIPLPERFFAGGGTSLRGLGLNEAGPRDAVTGFPLGGLALLVFNQELRFPMELPFTQGRAGGAVFYDFGNVYGRVGRINFRATPPPNDLNYTSHTIGFGVRYATPIGPVRLDFGYLINAARFSLPSAPGGVTRLPSFQFSFNFGSTF